MHLFFCPFTVLFKISLRTLFFLPLFYSRHRLTELIWNEMMCCFAVYTWVRCRRRLLVIKGVTDVAYYRRLLEGGKKYVKPNYGSDLQKTNAWGEAQLISFHPQPLCSKTQWINCTSLLHPPPLYSAPSLPPFLVISPSVFCSSEWLPRGRFAVLGLRHQVPFCATQECVSTNKAHTKMGLPPRVCGCMCVHWSSS